MCSAIEAGPLSSGTLGSKSSLGSMYEDRGACAVDDIEGAF